jgi:ATP-dependent DNA helicase DinG
VKSFDPDEDFPYVEPGDEGGIFLDADVVEVSTEATLELLNAITTALPGGGESREGQQQMAEAVATALTRKRHLIVEAGTGVGKSLAYLTPVAISGRRVVIATATKNLQDQLAEKDAPLVAARARGLSTAVLKGRSNYFCLQKAQETSSGERDELTFEVDERAWRTVSVNPQQCIGKVQCKYGNECFAELAKERAAAADVIIVNTALYGAHLATDGNILPMHDVVVFDEAHEVQDILARLLGTTIEPSRIRATVGLVRMLLPPSQRDGLKPLLDAADRLGEHLDLQIELGVVEGLSDETTLELASIAAALNGLQDAMKPSGTDSGGEVKRIRANQAVTHLLGDLDRIQQLGADELIWISREGNEAIINLSLITVGELLRDSLWPSITAIFTSATIPDTLAKNLGLPADNTDKLTVSSPFNYPENSLLYVAKHLPDRKDELQYTPAMLEELVHLINAAGGRTLALFTNKKYMEATAAEVAKRIKTPVLVQGSRAKATLLEKFRDDESASLFAVASFWQGVDVPGKSLSLVTIDRLPFQPPTDPVGKARRERAGDRGFYEVDLPRATMMLAQGVGRLIRSAEDRGVVAVFDNRLATASYRHQILKRLPPMKRTIDRTEAEAFLETI